MSWGIGNQCGACKKSDECLDPVIIQNGVNLIHTLWKWDGNGNCNKRGHLGSGTIQMNCNNFEAKEE
jgi:hypothetical protein